MILIEKIDPKSRVSSGSLALYNNNIKNRGYLILSLTHTQSAQEAHGRRNIMKLVGERTITKAKVNGIVKKIEEKEMSKGAGIREMFAGGMSVKEISAESGIHYNHVYNVVKNEVLVHDLEVEKTGRNNEDSKKNQILQLLEEGKTVTEISKELKCLYNYVWQVAKAGGYTGKKDQVAETKVATKKVTDKKAHTA